MSHIPWPHFRLLLPLLRIAARILTPFLTPRFQTLRVLRSDITGVTAVDGELASFAGGASLPHMAADSPRKQEDGAKPRAAPKPHSNTRPDSAEIELRRPSNCLPRHRRIFLFPPSSFGLLLACVLGVFVGASGRCCVRLGSLTCTQLIAN